MAGLRPPALDEAGVVAAIADLARDADQREKPKIEFSHSVEFDRLSPVLETTIFRIVQESLQVQDWGAGFDPEKVDRSRFGLRGIRERARLLGGRAAIETSPGQGTRVVVELPLERARDEG